jgi:putative GTP pyrophosphokinase
VPPDPAPSDRVRSAVQAYAALRPELEVATDRFVDLIRAQLDDAGINYASVTGRTKSLESFAEKAERTAAGQHLYANPLEEITDQIGVRVITYVRDDVRAVADLLAQELAVIDDRDLGLETAREGRFGYASRHLLVSVDASRTVPAAFEALRRRSAAVQVRTVLQHAWAEFEHDIRYKGTVPDDQVRDLDRHFTLAAGLIELADREFSAIRERLHAGTPPPPGDADDPRIGAKELAVFLAARFADAGWSRTDHYMWISGVLLELGITSLDELGEVLTGVDTSALVDRMGYAYPPGAVRRLDDALLAVYGRAYVALHGNEHRTAALDARLARLERTVGG